MLLEHLLPTFWGMHTRKEVQTERDSIILYPYGCAEVGSNTKRSQG